MKFASTLPAFLMAMYLSKKKNNANTNSSPSGIINTPPDFRISHRWVTVGALETALVAVESTICCARVITCNMLELILIWLKDSSQNKVYEIISHEDETIICNKMIKLF
jgi:hypothetical protein